VSIAAALALSACGGDSENISTDAISNNGSGTSVDSDADLSNNNTDGLTQPTVADDSSVDNGVTDEVSGESSGETPTQTVSDTLGQTPAGNETPNAGEPDPVQPEPVIVVPDPLVQNTTRIDFGITVPAYSSTTLQVRLFWGDKDIAVDWVGDGFWSVADDFPTDTENLLSISFTEGNGDIILGRYETNFRTGTNAAQSVAITADAFDTQSFDNDGDGVSNIDELVSGTDPLESPRVLLFSETRDGGVRWNANRSCC